jgi:signal transduction histidine kinase/ketosteroid isomerase-like protein
MPLSPREIAEARKVYETYWESYFTGNIKAFVACIDENFSIIGTSEGETAFGKEAVAAMYEAQFDEVVGKAEGRNRQVREIPAGDMVQIIEFSDIYVLIGSEWSFYSKFRLSTLLHQTPDGWKLLQQHGSLPDMRVGEGETVAIDKISKENLELRDAVKRRTAELENTNRELTVEAVLEKVRARSLTVQKVDEFSEVVSLAFEKLSELDIPVYSVTIPVFKQDSKDWDVFGCGESESGPVTLQFVQPYIKHPLMDDIIDAHDKNEVGYFSKTYSKEEKDSYYEFGFGHTELKNLPDDIKQRVWKSKAYTVSFAYAKHSMICVNDFNGATLTDHQVSILKKFSRVFEQAYIRFLDLQKAEAQAKEAQIEAALERVRSRSLAMHHSSELSAVVDTLLTEFTNLQFTLTFCIINLIDEQDMSNTVWAANPETGKDPESYYMKFEDYPFHHAMWDAWKAQKKRFIYTIEGEEKKIYDQYLYSETEFSRFPKNVQDANKALERYVTGFTFFRYSGLQTVSENYISEEDLAILERFGKVFEQAYTRFLDLQKAEAQAREARIETALEKVRSRSLAMQKSGELQDVIQIVYEQFAQLDIEVDHTGFIIDYPTNDDMHIWLADRNGVPSEIRIPYFDAPHWNSFVEAKNNSGDFFVNHHSFEEKNNFYKTIFELIPGLSDETKAYYLACPGLDISTVLMDNVGLYIERFSGTPYTDADNQTLKRFGKVFQQAYTRFLDLQKAEAQAREAQIEAGLERVRSASMAMHRSDELQKVVNTIITQLNELKVAIDTTQIVTMHSPYANMELWTAMNSNPQDISESWSLPYGDVKVLRELHACYASGADLFHQSFKTEEKNEFYRYVFSQTDFVQLNEDRKQFILNAPRATLMTAFVNQIAIQLISYSREKFNDEEADILKRFAKVFSQSHTRFLDLQKAEAQAHEAQIELALERVRAQVTAMQESTDLLDIVVTMRAEFVKLGHEAHYFWHMRWLPETYAKAMTSGDGTKIGMVMTLPRSIHGDIEAVADWEKGNEPVHVLAMDAETSVDYIHKMVTWGDFERVDPQAPTLDDVRHIGGLTFVMARTTHGEIGYSLPGVVPDPPKDAVDTLVRFAGVFDLAYKRFEDLKATERQTREARIELALEKVRSRTMGMQRSDELAEVANVLFAEMNGLVHNLWTCGFVLCEKDRAEDEWWLSLEDGFSRGFFLPNVNDYAHETLYDGWLEGDAFRTVQLDGDKLQEHYDWLMEVPVAKNIFDEMEAAGMQRPEWQKLHAAYFSKGYLVIITREPCPEEEIFKRFANVFDQTYTRFLDLKKAEAQAREAKIETALEKVRSRTIGMQSSDELPEIANMLFMEVQALGIPAWSCGYCILLEDRKSSTCIMSSEGTLQKPFLLPHGGEVSFDEWDDFIQSDENFFTQELGGKAIESHYGFMKSLPQLEPIFKDIEAAGLSLPNYQINHLCKFTSGFLLFITYEPVLNAHDIFRRFTRVFDQTYTRFLDLKKAEAQAREAQIEAALEKVRSRSLAMQSPDELIEVAQLLREEMGALGVEELETSSIYIHDENSGKTQCWFTIKDSDSGKAVTDQMTLNLQDTWVGQEMHTFYRSKAKQTSIRMHGEQRVEWIRYCGENSNAFTPEVFYGDTIPERTYHLYKFSHGYIGAASPSEISSESWDLLKRATSVFSFAYTRFRDLQKAETRAREARIELALERIRAQVASMQESSDLFDIVVGMRTEFLALGHEADYFWHMRWLPESYEMSMTSEDGSRIGMVITLPKFVHDEIPALAEWEKGNDPIYVLALDPEGAWNYIENMNTHGSYELADPNAPGKEDIAHIGGLTFIMARTTHGEIGYGLPGMVPNPPKDALDTLVRFAGVFDLAYRRFEDLKASEHQALMIREERDRLEIALNELRATQAQLVQQEKLASLGQLTAGIAHEIKNPLNFVNNFSEVSLELIDEALEELSSVQTQFTSSPGLPNASQGMESFADIKDILADVQSNLTKIHQHGTRANGIVSSMLQHSRGGSGKMEPTDLNALVKEYVNLAFHGMRAGKNPIDVDIKLDFEEKLDKVNLIGEDFSRVVLNLCNNAFDAMREKVKMYQVQRTKYEDGKSDFTAGKYVPKLAVSTKQNNGMVTISVTDNGPGIPDEIKDKILQPFFTTKKGTEGTGLGLSITHDIIKAHGGQLVINSKKEKSTSFNIELPLH